MIATQQAPVSLRGTLGQIDVGGRRTPDGAKHQTLTVEIVFTDPLDYRALHDALRSFGWIDVTFAPAS